MNKGFVILAQNTESVDYIKCAEILSMSIKQVMPGASVSLITTNRCDKSVFDHIIDLPYGDLAPNSSWKLINDWQVYEASPYEYTIKLEADMIISSSIDYWWDILQNHKVVVCSTIRDYKGNISDSKHYRKFIYDNSLPDVYNAITYFKKSDFAKTFFETTKDIFTNWDEFVKILKCNVNEIATTDWVYSLACHIHGIENTTIPAFTDMSMVHMKQYINNLSTEDWPNELVYEVFPECFRVNTFVQNYPFHYHVKEFSSILEKSYEAF
jgi:hypothetical protein